MNEQMKQYIEANERLLKVYLEAAQGLENNTLTIRQACELAHFTHTGKKKYLIERLYSKAKQAQQCVSGMTKQYISLMTNGSR